jgi:hypothetical protein
MSTKSTSPTSTTRKLPLKTHFLHIPDTLRVSNVRIFRVSSHKSQFKVACVSKREKSGAHENISLCCCRRAHTREYREKSVHPARQRHSAASRGLFSVINIIGNYKYSPSDYISRQRQFSGALTTPSLFLFIHFSPRC